MSPRPYINSMFHLGFPLTAYYGKQKWRALDSSWLALIIPFLNLIPPCPHEDFSFNLHQPKKR